MSVFKAKELRLKAKEELDRMLQEERIKLRDFNFKLAGAKLKNFNELGIIKKNIAKVLTVLRALSLPTGRQARSEAIGHKTLPRP